VKGGLKVLSKKHGGKLPKQVKGDQGPGKGKSWKTVSEYRSKPRTRKTHSSGVFDCARSLLQKKPIKEPSWGHSLLEKPHSGSVSEEHAHGGCEPVVTGGWKEGGFHPGYPT